MKSLKTFLKNIFSSSWEPIKYKRRKFMYGNGYFELAESAYRIHKYHDCIQKFAFDSQGGCWMNVSSQEYAIIKTIMAENNGLLPSYDCTSCPEQTDPMVEADKGCDPITGI